MTHGVSRILAAAAMAALSVFSPAMAGQTGAGAEIAHATAETELAPVQLIMVDQQGCIYCRKWEKEVGVEYPKTPQGEAAPLLRVNLSGPWPDGVALTRRPFVTPTFILLRDGKEEARIEGYPGEDFFWPLLDDMLTRSGVEISTQEPQS